MLLSRGFLPRLPPTLRLIHARTFWSRARGLLGRPPLGLDEGLLLHPCRAIHTFFMKGPLDVAFLDARGEILSVRAHLKPWRWAVGPAGTVAVLELAGGALARWKLRSHAGGAGMPAGPESRG